MAGAESGDKTKVVWERPEPTARPALSPLSRDRIVGAAIELADGDGLAAVSLRKVAAKLDAGPMRLYGYIATKEELLDLMADTVYGEIGPPEDAGGDWREALRTRARGMRQAAHRHTWFVDLLGSRPHVGPNALRHQEATLAAVDGVPGFADIDAVLKAVAAVTSYTIGAVRQEITDLRAERASGKNEQQMQQELGPYMERTLSTGRYPTVAKVVWEARHDDADTVFEVGLDYVIGGIAARVEI